MSANPEINPTCLPPETSRSSGAAGVFGPIVERLNELLGTRTFAEISRATGCNSETVRRYMRGGQPSVAFVVAVARHYRVSLDWLLLGEGSPRGRDASDQAGPASADRSRTQTLIGAASARNGERDAARSGEGYNATVRGALSGGALREGA